MPRAATSGELDLLRSDGQAARLYAAFFAPHTIYTAQLASVPSTTDQVAQISFSSGVGVLADVLPDMLLKIGSTAGGQELGYARIRKAPIAGTFYIGEQSIVNWSAVTPVYLTVVDDFDLWGRHVRIDGTTIYMDYDIAFSDQHTVFSPVPVLGPVVTVGKLTGASVTVQLGPETGYASWVFDSSISSYLWSCATAVSFSSTSAVRPTATFNTVGWHLVYCVVTAANGKTRRGMRYVYIYSDDSPPLTVAQLGENSEDSKAGGCNFTLSFLDQASLSEIPDRALCVLFAEDYYGTGDEQQQISIGAVTGRENIIYTGRVIAESLTYDDESQTASIEVQGYQELMKRIYGFPSGLRFKITPAVWTDMPAMTVDRALYHLLEFHTTALTIMDYSRTGDTRYTAQSFGPFSSIWEQMREFAERQIMANSRVDHLGRLWFEIDPQITPVADRDYPVVMTLLDSDLTGRAELPREVLSEVGKIDLSGVVIDGGGNPSAFFSLSPGHIHDRTGSIQTADRLLLSDQTQANALAGLIWGAKNNPYKPMRVKLRANNRILTCFPNQAVTYTISAANNPRGFAITKNWIPRQRKFSYDPETGALSVEMILEAESTPMHGIKGDVPGSGEFTFPPLPDLPPLPDIPIILPGGPGGGPGSVGGPASVLVQDESAGLLLCNNFNAGENEQEWYAVNGGLTVTQYQNISSMIRTPNGAIYVFGGIRGSLDHFIKRAPYAGGAFETIEDQASINTKLGTTGQDGGIGVISCNLLYPEFVAYTLCDIPANASLEIWRGSYPNFTEGASFGLSDPRVGDLSYGNGKWIYTGNGLAANWWRLDASLTTVEDNDPLPYGVMHRHKRLSTSDIIYHWQGNSFSISKSTGNCAAFINNIGSGYLTDPWNDIQSVFSTDPTGHYILTGDKKSSDYGYTLSSVSYLSPPFGYWRHAYAGGSDSPLRWVSASYGGYIWYTDDFYNSAPMDKRGNILDLAPILHCLDVIVVAI